MSLSIAFLKMGSLGLLPQTLVWDVLIEHYRNQLGWIHAKATKNTMWLFACRRTHFLFADMCQESVV